MTESSICSMRFKKGGTHDLLGLDGRVDGLVISNNERRWYEN